MTVLTLSNLLSLLRGPLALLFLPAIPLMRLIVLVVAAMTDYFDGFIARRLGTATPFGAILDPVMDKLFMLVAIGTLFFEGSLTSWQVLALLARDFFLALFTIYLLVTGTWRGYRPKAYMWGKIATVAQYVVLALVVMSVPVPGLVYAAFLLMGIFYLIQLVLLTT
jgi:CDP-diacylglycerol---glycerol-3-phosphate 3-phosphatidyltransferase